MIKIGIIDTEIRTDQIIFDKTHFCNADYKTSVLHGTEVANVLLKCFDEKIEGYKKCGSTDKKFDCKKDCIISYNAVLSYIN